MRPQQERALRRLELVAAVASGKWLEVNESRSATHATSTEIFVSVELPETEVRAAVLTQAALYGSGSLQAAWSVGLQHRGRSGRVAERYIALEVPRALRRRAPHLPGLDVLADSLGPSWPVSESAEESLRRARGREPLPGCLSWFGQLAPRLPAPIADVTSPEAVEPQRITDDWQTAEESESSQNADQLAKLLDEVSGGLSENWLTRRLGRMRRNASGSNGSGSSLNMRSSGRRRAGNLANTLSYSTAATASRTRLHWLVGDKGHRQSRLYPEYDVARLAMRPNHCTVYDTVAADSNPSVPLSPQADAELRRRLARVVLVPALSRRQYNGDEIDVEAAVDARAECVATGQYDDRVWMTPRPRRPDLAVMVLVDQSGSVSSRTHGVSTHQRQVEVAETISDALQAVGARLAVYGFRSHDRRNVELVRVQSFGATWDFAARRRLHACSPCGFTRLGAVIRRATDLISEDSGALRRILILVSDGIAYDGGYEGAYAEADTRHALGEANAKGIATLCVTVGSDTDDAAPDRAFGVAARVRARTVADLRGPFAAMIRAALRAAGSR